MRISEQKKLIGQTRQCLLASGEVYHIKCMKVEGTFEFGGGEPFFYVSSVLCDCNVGDGEHTLERFSLEHFYRMDRGENTTT